MFWTKTISYYTCKSYTGVCRAHREFVLSENDISSAKAEASATRHHCLAPHAGVFTGIGSGWNRTQSTEGCDKERGWWLEKSKAKPPKLWIQAHAGRGASAAPKGRWSRPETKTPTQGRFAPLNGAPDLQTIDLTRVTWATRPLLGSRSVPENLSIVPDLWFLSHSNHPSKKGRAH